MAGLGARDIKRQIKSVESTKQITKAMELVSTSKLKKIRARFDATKFYFSKVKETIKEIVALEQNIKHEMLEEGSSDTTLYVVITGDRGLCGGYNINLIKKAESMIKDKSKAMLITIGKKAKEYFEKRDYNIINSYEDKLENPKYEDAGQIYKELVEKFKQKEVSRVVLLYTRMISTLSQEPTEQLLLPLSVDDFSEDKAKKSDREIFEKEQNFAPDITLYEPSVDAVLEILIPKFVVNTLLSAFIEASTAEQAARMNAMESASENAQEMIDELTLSFNRARQAAITQEITEIVSGAEAL